MSAPATPSLPRRTAENPLAHRSRSQAHSHRKHRVVRRRGRAKDEIESEDEIVREVGTDSETDDLSSTNSDSDSDTEPVSEGAAVDGRSRPLTPSTSDSPQSHSKEMPAAIDDNARPFFTQPATWEDMVTEEDVHGPAALPVIDFTDFNGDTLSNDHVSRQHSRKSKKSLDGSRDRSSLSETKEDGKGDPDHHRSTSRRSHSSSSKRLPGQSARQAYQQRLESDPSFVPTLGDFWRHDERLLDKDLRSLSGWWRGRWQSRGRGRGFGVRGRGGHSQASLPHSTDASGPAVDLPPIERQWTHDGYEEMKRKEEQRRTALQQQQQANQTRGVRGGRGGLAAGGGGRGGLTRGGPGPSPARSNTTPSQGRVWYAMKPELMWTKQHEAFLFFDSSTKPRKGQGPSYRVRLPGTEIRVIQTAPGAQKDTEWRWPRSDAKALDVNVYTIRIPKRTSMELTMESLTTVEEASLEEIFTVRPNLVTPIPIPIPESAGGPSNTAVAVVNEASPNQEQKDALQLQAEKLTTSSQDADQVRAMKTEEAVMKKPTPEQSVVKQASDSGDQRPTLPPLQTVFTPPPIAHPSPATYGATYSYGPALPPGIALNAHGMPYEVASGRPIYLAPPMYTPRPMVPSHMTPGPAPFVPSHMHHSSISPDFMSQGSSHTPPVNGFVDASIGTPLFSLPRQTRIEIRAPTDEFDGKGSRKGQLRQAGSTTKTPTVSSPRQPFEPSNQTYYPSLTRTSETGTSPAYNGSDSRAGQTANGDLGNQQPADSHMMPYPPYQQYYYPESYGYYPYMDMSQVGQYDMYSSDPRGAQGSVYY
ncbi:hypothetical protein AX15_007223 [Amanita polypyramis BW_CC]|nr:hypothetical protein AX15_007223 [Amanita polypyramis BW_CC]